MRSHAAHLPKEGIWCPRSQGTARRETSRSPGNESRTHLGMCSSPLSRQEELVGKGVHREEMYILPRRLASYALHGVRTVHMRLY